jgi:hypothetical protein
VLPKNSVSRCLLTVEVIPKNLLGQSFTELGVSASGDNFPSRISLENKGLPEKSNNPSKRE